MSPLWRLALTPRRTIFSFAKRSIWPLPPNSGISIPQQELVDEEICPDYNSANFYPAKPGTVLKEIENHITHHNPEHHGCMILRTCMDDFEVTGPEGKHMCLVYEPMREPFWIFQRRFIDHNVPLPLVKPISIFSLLALIISTQSAKSSMVLGNILMTFEDESVLENFINQQQPMQYKVDESGRTIYRCHNDFGPLDASKTKNMFPKLVDFGLTTRLDKPSTLSGMVGEQFGIYPIQPDYYRAPEVILGCGWDFKADIWNFGVLLWDIIGSKELFQKVHDQNGHYDAKLHLAEMIALLGPPPRILLEKSKAMAKHHWPYPVRNDTGELCNSAEEFFHGPFFNAEDEFRYSEFIPSLNLEDTITILEEKDREAFLSFAQQMLSWQPEKRKTASELMDHPFLKLGG